LNDKAFRIINYGVDYSNDKASLTQAVNKVVFPRGASFLLLRLGKKIRLNCKLKNLISSKLTLVEKRHIWV
jgi:hypothetical protein